MSTVPQRHCARYIYAIPDGLRELMNDISREVLRNQPLNVYTFIADYLDALLITRENARVAVRLVEVLTELSTTTTAFLRETGMRREKIDIIVKLVQDSLQQCLTAEEDLSKPPQKITDETKVVKEIMEKIDVSPEMADTAATIVQQAYKKFKERKDRERRLLRNIVDWRVAARTAITMYRNTGVSNQEANRAATLIKAAYKGYYTRRLLKATLQQYSLDSEDLPDYFLLFDDDTEKAEDETDIISKEEKTGENLETTSEKSKSDYLLFEDDTEKAKDETDIILKEEKTGENLETTSEKSKSDLLFDDNTAEAKDETVIILKEEKTGETWEVASEKSKSVKIDYNTVKPHVDFDTNE